MKARHIAIALGLAVGAQPLLAADGARERQPRPGGGNGGRAPATHSPASKSSGGSGATFRAPRTGAEQRHPRPGTGSGRHRPHGYSSYYPYYGFYPGYWGLGYYYRPYYPYYYGYWGSPYYYPYRDNHAGSGAIRALVEPEETRVLVDGYYAGIANDFDGVFQRLYVAPGRHEITLKLDGYRTHRVRVYVAADSTLKLRHRMEKGTGEESFEDLAGEREPEPGAYEERGPRRPGPDSPGRLRLEVRPDDASVYVDGQFWGTARLRAEIELPPGRHRVEVVRPGYRTEERDVEIESGRMERLEVELVRP